MRDTATSSNPKPEKVEKTEAKAEEKAEKAEEKTEKKSDPKPENVPEPEVVAEEPGTTERICIICDRPVSVCRNKLRMAARRAWPY